ncbi:uncharacterized protein F5147DRAFT_777939 [Suillus discolor]|uniref:Uncharacterized protein n=1 Tax=Suillus discolor TaxID=1912936 RepID=A0A9P7EZU4_9AGAM|nr:uncharacterized protein F5147DRAFT_777939 [Suillus discolor]KAG2097776.1 hypothetical protein F5147DRAFT_777939 [Suillus discolor]
MALFADLHVMQLSPEVDAKKENSSGHGKDALPVTKTLLKEYADKKQKKATGTCISTKSKVNDITQTLKAIENELNSLNCRTGAEVMLYMTRGSTDLPL